MTHNPSGRQKSSHLRLTPAEVKALWQQNLFNARSYLYLLAIAHRRVEWKWQIDNVSAFCEEWDIPRRTFYKAKAALILSGLLSENIVGSFELIPHACPQELPVFEAMQTECAQRGTPVPKEAQPVHDRAHCVPKEAQPVHDRAHLTLETTDIQSVCDSTSLKQLITPTTQDVCVSEDVNNSELRTEVGVFDRQPDQVKNAESPNEAIPPDKDTYAPPILIQAKKKFGINLEDTQLRKSIEFWPERVETAIACLEEKQLTVKYPTRFLQRAIEEDWKPEKRTGGSEWRDWFNEAYDRGLVSAGRQDDGVQYVLTADDHWVPFEHLRRQSWEELEAQLKPITVEAQSAADELTPGQSQIIEAMAVLVEV